MNIEGQFAKKLKLLRKRADLTQEKLAELSGLEYKYIQMLEGKNPPSATLRTLSKIAKAFRIEVWQLVKFSTVRRRSTTQG